MIYNRCGNSGLKLPAISLGLWHNFGAGDVYANSEAILKRAYELGITHFDVANNYGRPYDGSAEETLGKILKKNFSSNDRDRMVIATKAGFDMWGGGPYEFGGSKKYLISSLDQSLKRLGLDYVDIFYHHVPDSETPLEETMAALDLIVRQGKALYVGISNYNSEQTKKASEILKKLGTPCLINQVSYSMFDRHIEEDNLFETHKEEGIGTIAFVPLAQGLLTDKYIHGIPEDSRIGRNSLYLHDNDVTEEKVNKIIKLNEIAKERGQSLAQMALAWTLRGDLTSTLIGASKVKQVEDNVKAIENLSFSQEELDMIDTILR
ncbi:aldo/keto reductase [Inconstantimicrobium mannanitabidum]|uniref:Glyceraldehyde 3-phosphate reductase n=1 Tax=Inconstantimicrobium mannanitabidum TaxID=1604901 RepID=A0ACB5R6Q6_9CLOT|nr:aldo/keto reductase [Clostridium sp. TW13]GKX64795.1 glyceraldehyde 3-phosphate reductase [Clostridium sp. TW13]